MGQRGIPIALEEVQLVLIWVKDWWQVDLPSLKLYFVLILNEAFTSEIINLPIRVWVSITERATENKDTAAPNRERDGVMDRLSQLQIDHSPLVKFNTVPLDGIHRTVDLIITSEDKDNLVKADDTCPVSLALHRLYASPQVFSD